MLLGYFSNRFSTDAVVKKTLQSSSENLLLINRNLNNLIKSVEHYATNLTMLINKELENVNLNSMTAIDELNIQSKIQRTFNYVIYSYPNISSGMFVSNTGVVFGGEYMPAGPDHK